VRQGKDFTMWNGVTFQVKKSQAICWTFQPLLLRWATSVADMIPMKARVWQWITDMQFRPIHTSQAWFIRQFQSSITLLDKTSALLWSTNVHTDSTVFHFHWIHKVPRCEIWVTKRETGARPFQMVSEVRAVASQPVHSNVPDGDDSSCRPPFTLQPTGCCSSRGGCRQMALISVNQVRFIYKMHTKRLFRILLKC